MVCRAGNRGVNLNDRRVATQRTFDMFRGEAFGWRSRTCIHVAHFHLQALGRDLPPLPAFHSPATARRAMKAMGASDLSGLLERAGLQRIAPAAMIVGDIAVLPGEAGSGVFDSVAICAGNKFMGWSGWADSFQSMLVDPVAIKAAFRG